MNLFRFLTNGFVRILSLFCVGFCSIVGLTWGQNGRLDGLDELSTRTTIGLPMSDGVRLATDIYLPVFGDDLALDNLTLPFQGTNINIERLVLAPRGTQYIYYPKSKTPYQLPIVFTRTPYGKNDPTQGQLLALMGYAGVLQDMRGRYASEGTYYPMYSDSWDKSPYYRLPHPLDTTRNATANRHEDGYQSIQYLLNQLRWDSNGDSQITNADRLVCNGDIGMFGASALGNSQLQAAAVRPIDTRQAGLKCLFPIVASGEHYAYSGHYNGTFRQGLIDGWLRGQIESYNFSSEADWSVLNGIHSLADFGPGMNNRIQVADKAVDSWTSSNSVHDPFSPFHASMDISSAPVNAQGLGQANGTRSRYTNLDVPTYHLTGWWDIFIDGQIRTWQLQRQHSRRNGRFQKLVIGPFAHQTIGQRQTGDMRIQPNGADHRYPENVSTVLPIDNANITDIGRLVNSEVVHWFRTFLGEPTVMLPPARRWQRAGTLLNIPIEAMVPADTVRLPFEQFFNFLNGKAGIPLTMRIKGLPVIDTNNVLRIDVPATGVPLLGQGSDFSIQSRPSFDGSQADGIADVRMYVVGPVADNDNRGVGNYWLGADTFPLPNTQRLTLYLHNEGLLSPNPDTEGSLTYLTDPLNPVRTHGGANMLERTPTGDRLSQGQMNLADPLQSPLTMNRPLLSHQGTNYPDVLAFQTAVFTDTLSVIGVPTMQLFAASQPIDDKALDSTNTDFIVRVIDVYPDGRQMYVWEGAVNARAREYAAQLRNGVDNRQIRFSNIVSGQVYGYDFQMLPIAYTFGKGHRMKLLVSSTNYPRFQSCPNLPLNPGDFFRWKPGENKTYTYRGQSLRPRSALNTIHTSSQYPTAIQLPVMNASLVSRVLDTRPEWPITVFPNPTQDQLSIRTTVVGQKSAQLINALGQVVRTQSFVGNEFSWQLGDLPAGIYTVIVRQGAEQATQKVVLAP